MEVGFQKSFLGDIIGCEGVPVAHAEQEPSERFLQGVDLGYELLPGNRRLCRLVHLFLLIEIGNQECDSHTEHNGCDNQNEGHYK